MYARLMSRLNRVPKPSHLRKNPRASICSFNSVRKKGDQVSCKDSEGADGSSELQFKLPKKTRRSLAADPLVMYTSGIGHANNDMFSKSFTIFSCWNFS